MLVMGPKSNTVIESLAFDGFSKPIIFSKTGKCQGFSRRAFGFPQQAVLTWTHCDSSSLDGHFPY